MTGPRTEGEVTAVSGRLDVIVPVRDAERHLDACLQTIRANAPDGTRFLMVDDGSTDRTPWILEDAARTMPYVVHLRTDHAGGAARARNTALDLVDARYLTFLDADDWWAPGHVASMLASAEALRVDVVRTDHVRVDGLRRTPERAPWDERGVAVPAADGIGDAGGKALVDYPYLWAGVYDLTSVDPALLRFDESLRTASDRPWFWRLHLRTRTFAVVDSPGYFYRRSDGSGSLTQSRDERLLDFLPAYHRVLDLAFASGVASHERRAVFGACRIVAFHVKKRARLGPDLQARLMADAAALLARADADTLEAVLPTLPPDQHSLLRGLYRAGRGVS